MRDHTYQRDGDQRDGSTDEHFHPDDLATFAIGALPATEAIAVMAHLKNCVACSAATAEYADTASGLAQILPELQPRKELGAQVIAAATATDAEPLSLERERERRQPAIIPGWLGRSGPWAAAAAAAVAIVVLGLLAIDARDDAGDAETKVEQLQQTLSGGTVFTLLGTEEAPDARVTMIIAPDRDQATVIARGLPENDSDHVYQLWLFQAGEAQSLGAFDVEEGETLQVPLRGDILASDSMAITLEEGDGAESPTGPALVAGDLSG